MEDLKLTRLRPTKKTWHCTSLHPKASGLPVWINSHIYTFFEKICKYWGTLSKHINKCNTSTLPYNTIFAAVFNKQYPFSSIFPLRIPHGILWHVFGLWSILGQITDRETPTNENFTFAPYERKNAALPQSCSVVRKSPRRNHVWRC